MMMARDPLRYSIAISHYNLIADRLAPYVISARMSHGPLKSAKTRSANFQVYIVALQRSLWHHSNVISLCRILSMLLVDLMRFMGLLFVSRDTLLAENLFLRRPLAFYKERGIKPRRVDAATRVSLTVLSRLFDWRNALVVVRPETLVRWHRAGWRLFWRYKCRNGRPPIPLELRQLIRRMAQVNPLWGEERIAYELLVKLGLRVSPRTVRKYMPKRPPGRPRGDQRWATFLRNHARAIRGWRTNGAERDGLPPSIGAGLRGGVVLVA